MQLKLHIRVQLISMCPEWSLLVDFIYLFYDISIPNVKSPSPSQNPLKDDKIDEWILGFITFFFSMKLIIDLYSFHHNLLESNPFVNKR